MIGATPVSDGMRLTGLGTFRLISLRHIGGLRHGPRRYRRDVSLVGRSTIKRMFGGKGIYVDGRIVAVELRGELRAQR